MLGEGDEDELGKGDEGKALDEGDQDGADEEPQFPSDQELFGNASQDEDEPPAAVAPAALDPAFFPVSDNELPEAQDINPPPAKKAKVPTAPKKKTIPV